MNTRRTSIVVDLETKDCLQKAKHCEHETMNCLIRRLAFQELEKKGQQI